MQELKEKFEGYFNLDERELNMLINLFDKIELSKGDAFLHQGDTCKELAFIKEGIFRISTLINGIDATQWIATEEYYITDLANFMQGSKSRWDIVALTDSTLYSISKSNYDTIDSFIPDWSKKRRSF